MAIRHWVMVTAIPIRIAIRAWDSDSVDRDLLLIPALAAASMEASVVVFMVEEAFMAAVASMVAAIDNPFALVG